MAGCSEEGHSDKNFVRFGRVKSGTTSLTIKALLDYEIVGSISTPEGLVELTFFASLLATRETSVSRAQSSNLTMWTRHSCNATPKDKPMVLK
eukprot:gnl/MRDRNA2_/MRDRNA2_468945_c0_seq1.p1 gnl/MRDRNA2_/MRDRNA2_468945_c0~~gnl/MRDRNA2_/MRDRNA2_468945_c0_seq1.p1  ORF type:complete len:100 (+),score=9.72 gnl/MRDRNA2_/MRDRNA2_468945_c0_seq1:24-302(+)